MNTTLRGPSPSPRPADGAAREHSAASWDSAPSIASPSPSKMSSKAPARPCFPQTLPPSMKSVQSLRHLTSHPPRVLVQLPSCSFQLTWRYHQSRHHRKQLQAEGRRSERSRGRIIRWLRKEVVGWTITSKKVSRKARSRTTRRPRKQVYLHRRR